MLNCLLSNNAPSNRFFLLRDHNIYEKVVQWFAVMSQELHCPAIGPENVYMDETGVLLSILSSLKVLVSNKDVSNVQGTGSSVLLSLLSNASLPMEGLYPH
jgi:hypothetical protein